MKRILFDFISFQNGSITGSALYVKNAFYEILNNEVEICGLYDGNIIVDKPIKAMAQQHKITLLDIRDKDIIETINSLYVDTFFIGCASWYDDFDLRDLKCRMVVVRHDADLCSLEYFNIYQAKPIENFTEKHLTTNKKGLTFRTFIKYSLFPLVLIRRYFMNKKKEKMKIVPSVNFGKLIQMTNVSVITDSEYSQYAIQYFWGSPANKIKVLYPPFANNNVEEKNKDIDITSTIRSKKYFLLISTHHPMKNAVLFLEQWEKFCLATNYEYHCVLVGNGTVKANIKNSVFLENVSSEQLAELYKNAFAFVYLSFKEGFGYPPIEAAMHGTPSICSNVTSIPEICGDMPIYFSPFYPEDLFRAMIKMVENRDIYVEKAKKRFLEVSQRQEEDFQKLIDFILGENSNV